MTARGTEGVLPTGVVPEPSILTDQIPSLQFIQDLETAQLKIAAGIEELYPLQELEAEDKRFRQVLEQSTRIFRKQEDKLKDAHGVKRGNKRVTIISTKTTPDSIEGFLAFIDYEIGNPRRVLAGIISKNLAHPHPANSTDIDSYRSYIDNGTAATRGQVMLIDESPVIQKAFETAFENSKDKAEEELKKEQVKKEARKRSKIEKQNRIDGDSIQRALANARHIFEDPTKPPTS